MDKESIRDYELDIIVKAWRDETFRQNLLKDPKKAIQKEFDLEIPKDISIFVHEENEHNLHLIVPSQPSNFASQDISDDDLKEIIGGVMAKAHLVAPSSIRDRARIRELEQENERLKKDILGNKS